jgi:hypothetical protein
MAQKPQSLSDLPPRQGLLLGLGLTALAIYIELLSFDVIKDSGRNAPPFIGALAGIVFLLPGLL